MRTFVVVQIDCLADTSLSMAVRGETRVKAVLGLQDVDVVVDHGLDGP